eukprot:1254917-Pleurochrysis_carterae.AAC.1
MRAPAEHSFVRPTPVTPTKRSFRRDSGTATRPSPLRSCYCVVKRFFRVKRPKVVKYPPSVFTVCAGLGFPRITYRWQPSVESTSRFEPLKDATSYVSALSCSSRSDKSRAHTSPISKISQDTL